MSDAKIPRVKQNAFAVESRRQGRRHRRLGESDRRAVAHQGDSLVGNALFTEAPPLVFAQNLESIDTAPPKIREFLQYAKSARGTVLGRDQTFRMKVSDPIDQTAPQDGLQRCQEVDQKRRRSREQDAVRDA